MKSKPMICSLCLENSKKYFNFFETKGLQLNASGIVAKYFWFQPGKDDSISEIICMKCWEIINGFHCLYQKVEESRNGLTEQLNELKIQPETILSEINVQKSEIFDEYYGDPFLKATQSPVLICDNDHFDSDDNEFEEKYQIDQNPDVKNIPLSPTKQQDEKQLISESDLNETTRKSTRLNRKLSNNFIKVESITSSEEKEEDILIQSAIDGNLLINEKKKRKKTIKSIIKAKKRTKKLEKQQDEEENKEIERMKAGKKLKMQEGAKIIDSFGKWNCPLCSTPLEEYSKLQKHFMEFHKNQKSYVTCCNLKFFRRFKLVDHVLKHVNPESFKCELCEKVLANRFCVKSHMQKMHSEAREKKFECPQCKKHFATVSELMRHEGTHIPESDREFKCEFCDRSYGTSELLRIHKKTVHDNSYGGICDICGKQYRQNADLRRHRLEHDGITMPKIQCPVCHIFYSGKYKLKRHMKQQHLTRDQRFDCPHCDKVSTTIDGLKSHIRYTHKMDRKFNCTLCEKAFKLELELKEHMAWHTGTALYQCPHCPRTFSHNSNLHHHRKKVHKAEFEAIRAEKGKRYINWKKIIEIPEARL